MEEKEEEENLSRVKEKPMILFFHALSLAIRVEYNLD